jgi:hypothetical protein
VADLIRKIIRSILPNIHRKSIWTKNEEDLIKLLKQYFLLNQTTKDEIETFLRNNRISFEVSKQNTLMTSPVEDHEHNSIGDEISIILPGPQSGKVYYHTAHIITFDSIS